MLTTTLKDVTLAVSGLDQSSLHDVSDVLQQFDLSGVVVGVFSQQFNATTSYSSDHPATLRGLFPSEVSVPSPAGTTTSATAAAVAAATTATAAAVVAATSATAAAVVAATSATAAAVAAATTATAALPTAAATTTAPTTTTTTSSFLKIGTLVASLPDV